MTNNKEYDAFEEMLKLVYNDIKNLDNDRDFEQIKNIYTSKSNSINPYKILLYEGLKRAGAYPKIYNDFKDGKRDHKVPAKKIVDQFYHKEEKNTLGKPAAVFGTSMSGDDKQILDHDVWGNISYGYLLKKAGFHDWDIEYGAKIDDIWQSFKADKEDKKDDPMVKIGMALYDNYEAQGKEMSIDDFRNEIIANKDKLRSYEKSILADRRYRAKGGEDMVGVAEKYGLTAEELIEYNNNHKQGVKNLSKEQTLLPDVKPILPDPEESLLMQRKKAEIIKQTPIESKKNNFFQELQKYDNRTEDILYKDLKDISAAEVKEAQKALFNVNDKDLKNKLDDKVYSWYQKNYGKDTLKHDATGRVISQDTVKDTLLKPSELKSKDDMVKSGVFQKAAEKMNEVGVRSMQKGLNMFGLEPKLKEDNVIGPKTTSRIKQAASLYGVSEINQKANMGAFSGLLEDNHGKPVEKTDLQKNVWGLDKDKGGEFLQTSLNKIGESTAGFTPLKVDNDIGDKTTQAFNELKDNNEEQIKTSLFGYYAKPENYYKQIK
ncbi:MAG: hypothetical protein LBR70_05305 [Lactobacillaceae bacterium]|jgi:hypothetical protein|nr:hypothetical protein [Lactobacillaceae bacterium]